MPASFRSHRPDPPAPVSRLLLLVLILAASGCATPGGITRVGHAASDGVTGGVPIKVMSYNIQYGGGGGRLAEVADAIAAEAPDVVALQEVDVRWSARSDFEDQAASLAAALGMEVRFAPIYDIPDSSGARPARRFGLALLSRHPIVHAVNHPLTRHSTQEPGARPRPQPGFQEVHVEFGGTRVRVFNTHLDYRPDPAVRARQVEEMLALLGPRAEATILMGDLNAGPSAPELGGLFARMTDAWSAGSGPGLTMPAVQPSNRIDYVLLSGDIRVTRASVPTTTASDHRPVVAEIVLPPGRGWSEAPAVAAEPRPAPAPASQNPSPMVETTRAHERLEPMESSGSSRTFSGPGGRPVELFVPDIGATEEGVDLVVFFHGAPWLVKQSAASLDRPVLVAAVNLGAGSNTYDRAFASSVAFDSLLIGVETEAAGVRGGRTTIRSVVLAGFSAGHGAIRAILREPRHFERIDAVLLLDGMHTGYVPARTVVAEGGALDTTNLTVFASFAQAAVRGEKRFLITHSTIFPGTFASTTETADWLLERLGLRRTPVLRWGPRGMQQLSEVREEAFEVMGFAGNSAPDHIDHLHALPELLGRLLHSGIRTPSGSGPLR
jgi:endonuclease/exonuclease/phosphatase family metal-dependent hydrolase